LQLGTHLRAKNKREEMTNALRKMRCVAQPWLACCRPCAGVSTPHRWPSCPPVLHSAAGQDEKKAKKKWRLRWLSLLLLLGWHSTDSVACVSAGVAALHLRSSRLHPRKRQPSHQSRLLWWPRGRHRRLARTGRSVSPPLSSPPPLTSPWPAPSRRPGTCRVS